MPGPVAGQTVLKAPSSTLQQQYRRPNVIILLGMHLSTHGAALGRAAPLQEPAPTCEWSKAGHNRLVRPHVQIQDHLQRGAEQL